MPRAVFIISDGTGITAESLGNSLLTQFDQIQFDKQTFPYIDSLKKAQQVVKKLNAYSKTKQEKPIVFITIVNPEITACIKESDACVLDLFTIFLAPLEEELQVKSSYTVGRSHSVAANTESYIRRIEAVNYALAHDDGVKTRGYEEADIILIGVSRCGKTPSCLYMALQFGVMAANYPFTEEDFENFLLPNTLKSYHKKLFGLTIEPERLRKIRTERSPNSRYASIEQCRKEIKEVEAMYRYENIPFLNSTHYSIEEIVTKIMASAGLKRKLSS